MKLANILLFLLMIFLPFVVQAQTLVINDCYGFTRAVKSAKEGEAYKVEVKVQSSSGVTKDGARVSLTEVATGKIIEAYVTNGVVVFDNLHPGIFTLATTTSDLEFGFIAIGPMELGGAIVTGAAVGGGAVVAGGSAGLIAGVNNVVNNRNNPTPTPLPTIIPTTPITPVPTCAVCEANATPKPIPTFGTDNELSPFQ